MYTHLFSELNVGGVTLKNRLTMAPLYLGYAGDGGTVSQLLLEHYRLMAKSGVAMIVVENSTIDHPTGSGSDRTLRSDTDENNDGLKKLSSTIKQEGCVACLQINHAGRFAGVNQPVAPSAVETFGKVPQALNKADIRKVVNQFADAALRVKNTGFDMVELHGGTGYLLAQFLSPRTNQRNDEYGGSLENRQRFALEVVNAVKNKVGDFPVGYRFMADEWLPDGLQLDESVRFARSVESEGIAYLSVMGGTYESFFLPDIISKSRENGYMVDLSAAVKNKVHIPVIAAGRIATGSLAESILEEKKADLIGLARVLWADPQWPEKIMQGKENDIVHYDPGCGDTCMKLVMKRKPAFCVRWNHDKLVKWKNRMQT
ncbi:MAG: NADH:flavin oxidoreductase [Thermodesulfobacteriota bacterium]|nr:NADH:flavin oxidoreductase [Thermodesulfobacteriota bacterium]